MQINVLATKPPHHNPLIGLFIPGMDDFSGYRAVLLNRKAVLMVLPVPVGKVRPVVQIVLAASLPWKIGRAHV